jgi:hypothetical protein
MLHNFMPGLRKDGAFDICAFMAHEKRIVLCAGPGDTHAFHGITRRNRSGDLDQICPECDGHGQWNCELDLVSQRSKRELCQMCDARGWIETGDDLLPSHDIALSDDGQPKWVMRLDPPKR